jgi:Phytanoyl-CoA dioxygenase (PhyH)
MSTRQLTLDYDDEQVTFSVEGETAVGEAEVLLHGDDDLTASQDWAPDGFTVAPFLSPDEFARLTDGIRTMLGARIAASGIAVPDEFALERYHRVVTTDAAHAAVSARGPWCHPVSELAVPVDRINARVSEILGVTVSTTPPHAEFPEHFCYRVVRPRSRDNNPPHRDVWLDRLRHAVNIYVPFAGSTPRSSLPLVRGSHRWKESEIERTTDGARVNGMTFTVPSVVGAAHPLRLERPNPGPNEVLVFSPYLIHGGAFNQQADTTRVSLEMRFWRVPN